MKINKKEIKNQIENSLRQNFDLEPDGHGIYLPEYYYNIGIPPEFVDQFIKEHHSDGTIKGTIHNNGVRKSVAIGVYNLDLLRGIANLLGLNYPHYFGRGREADAIVNALKINLGVK